MKRTFWKVLVVGVVLTGLVGPQPAHAAKNTAGGLAFAGTAQLPTFPCAAPTPGQQPCNGTFNGSVIGSLTGSNDGTPWTLAITAPVSVTFSYADNIEPGVRCVEGTARAAGTVTGTQLNSQVQGVYGNASPTQLPRSIIAASVKFGFGWYRVGTTANMKFDRLIVEVTVFGEGTPRTVLNIDNTDGLPGNDSATGAVGYGAAGFIPTNFGQAHAAACEGLPGSSPQPLSAEVAGNVEFAV